MSDQEDHNYYTRSNRQSQLSDYDVNGEPSNNDLTTLPAFAYRGSREYSPKRPTVTTSFDHSHSNPRSSRALGVSGSAAHHHETSQDPHEFYRQYRESFQRRPDSVYGQFDARTQPHSALDPMASVQRQSPSASRTNGYNPSPVSARWNRSMESRTSNLPVAERSGSKQSVTLPRARNDIKALVNKFNSVRDESPPAPVQVPARTSSATHITAPAGNPTPNSFKTRASADTRSNISALGSRPTRDSLTGKLGGGGTNQANPSKQRRTSHIAGSALSSQSMTDLSPSTTPRQPLFGEVMQNGVDFIDPGFGIPGSRRRGSEGSLQRSSTIFLDDSGPNSATSLEPSSPSAWYTGVTPSLDGLNLNNGFVHKRAGTHRRSRSDIGLGHLALAPHSVGSGKPVTILSPAQELSTPSPGRTSRPPSQSRIPYTPRRASVTSDSGRSTSSGYRTPTSKSGIPIPTSIHIPQTPRSSSSRMNTPRRSPRYRNPSPPLQSGARLAYVAESSPPLKSPPLRSSRPRMSVSKASTAASRARTSSILYEDGKPRPPSKIPNLPPNANMEQRRQMIRRDFTKSWHEKEERHKRQSLYMQGLNDATIPELPSNSKAAAVEPSELPLSSPETTSEAFVTPLQRASPGKELTIDMAALKQSSNKLSGDGDSPTLGTADSRTVTRKAANSSPEPASSLTEDTADLFLDQSAEGSEARSSFIGDVDFNHDLTPRLALSTPHTAVGNGDSIPISLGFTPTLDTRPTSSEPLRPVASRVLTSSSQSERKYQQDSNTQATDQSDSTIKSTTPFQNVDDIPWSPTSFLAEAENPDRGSSNSIEALLDSYQDSEPRRLFSQSPGLARAGGWDNSKVTRMYLQARSRKTPELGDAPPAPVFQNEQDNDIFQAARMNLPPQNMTRSRSLRSNSAPNKDVFVEPPPPQQQGALDVSGNKIEHRASLFHRDDFTDASPSMLDWMHHQQPADDSTLKFSQPQQKLDDGFSPDVPGAGLGIVDMNPEMSSSFPSEMPADMNFISELASSPPKRNSSLPAGHINELHASPNKPAEMSATGNTPPRKPVPMTAKSLQAAMSDMKPLPEITPSRIKKTLSAPTNGVPSHQHPSISDSTKSNGSPADAPQDDEAKRLRRRLNIIKELINTESTYGQDMTVVVDIYKGTCNVVLNSVQDERALFINTPDIVAFSTVFLDTLKGSARSVYTLPKSKRWRSKRDSSATQESSTEDHQSLYGAELSDEERDRLTCIGSAFLEHLPEMERVYTEFLKNSETANAKLKALQEDEKVKVWLDECCAYAKDLTTAWSLDSLLVKPLQRITKYPLLLKELCDVTPENHPDFIKLDTAAREISGVSKRINEAKRRMEMVEKVTQSEKIKKKDEGRLNLQKAFGRRSDKYKVPVGLHEQFQDRDYNQTSDKFGTHFFKLQIVMRDVEMYLNDVQGWVKKFSDVTVAIEDYFNVGQTTYPDLESKWRRFRTIMRDMQTTALNDHVAAVRKFVVDPMTTLLKLHEGPQRLMEKRKRRVPDYVKFKTMKEKGEKIDKKTSEAAELFLAVNDALKDELPKLFEMTSRLVEACLNNFVQLQLQWQSVWKRKMIQAIELGEVPRSFMDIVSDFSGDFRYTEAQVLSLGICNGSILADASAFLPTMSQTTTMVGDSRRPSASVSTESSVRARAASNAGPVAIDLSRVRGYSGPSPMLPSPDLGRPTEGLGLGSHLTINSPRPGQGVRMRANSTTSSRSPATPEISHFRNPQQTSSTPSYGRPSTSTGRSYDSIPSFSTDSSRLRPDANNGYYNARDTTGLAVQQPQTAASFRSSGIFSSAMPMSDSPRASSPVHDAPITHDFNVLFLAASVYEFNIDRARREAGYPYLTYVAGEIFDVIAEKGELWLAKNQDDEKNQVGWIWNKHFAKLAS